MIIKVDSKGKNAIEQLVDIALKQGGLSNFNPAGMVLESIELLPEPDKKPEKKPDKKKK